MFLVLNSIKRQKLIPHEQINSKSCGLFNPYVIWKQNDVNIYLFFANLSILMTKYNIQSLSVRNLVGSNNILSVQTS